MLSETAQPKSLEEDAPSVGAGARLLPDWRRPEILEAVFEQCSDALILYDNELVITGVNRAAARLLGIPSTEMVGKTCRDVFACHACESECGILHGLQAGNSYAGCSVRLRGEGGQERLAIVRTSRLEDELGNPTGVVASISDVTAETVPPLREVVAESPAMRDVLSFVRRVAASEASTILIEGENGTGKDLIAKTLHYQSLRAAGPFIAINCAAIPETLLESELFGYEKGAFTDAKAQKKGLFELADKGTLFLDEIGEIPHVLQAKLLRVLEEQSFRRLGGVKDIGVDVRVIAATNKDLREAVKERAFRQDLYFRLNVIQLTLPPLRERPEDIMPMVRFFIDHYNRKFKRHIEGVSPAAEQALLRHAWPGNVRELRNALERAMILEESPLLTLNSLPRAITEALEPSLHVPVMPQLPAQGISWEENERMLLQAALKKATGNQTKAAKLLGITRDKLRYQMKKFNLSDDRKGGGES